ncbi:MAG: hypothetical protein AD742_04590 [Methylibium sp. NZG]|nr:MAG: hypothetical protein AD742_04590 [Methylibium sp. NZG]
MQTSEGSVEVTVYNYLSFDGTQRSPFPAPYKAPRDRIETALNGKVLEGTAETVLASQLDHEGRYRRRATGWGDLD